MKKRFALSLALLAGLAVGATSANAASIKATGSWQVDAALRSENDFNANSNADDNKFSIGQRMRTKFEFIANENLKGVLETQIGTNSWGNGLYQISAGRTPNSTATGALAAGNGNLILRKGYVDFKWPNTKVNFLVGYQSLSLPAAFGLGSPILDDHFAAAAAVVPVTDNLSLVGGYARPYDANNFGSTSSLRNVSGTSTDAAFLYANLDFTGFKVQPFFAYGYAGSNTGGAGVGANLLGGMAAPTTGTAYGTRAYWGGAAFTMTALDPFKVMADVNFGKATYNGAARQDSGRGGWLADIAVDYTGLSMMTPEVFFAYSSGENKDGSKSERMPVLSAENWAYGSFWMQGGDTLNTSYTAPGSTLAQGNPNSNLGFWAAGLSLKDIKLIDKLSHTVHFIYFKGTNAKEVATMANTSGYGQLLTTKDSLFEVDLNSKYQIYEELSLGLELGYINADFDKNVWAAAGADRDKLSKDAYKAVFMLNYSF
ncbi:MAG: outer membrane homotrimeric porin [Desulfovibrio sp.]|jgi:hypothetical protein|nr:outer membrane homotrimeric porin [Desulfovibrio sp.]